jgi:hypothetical protein
MAGTAWVALGGFSGRGRFSRWATGFRLAVFKVSCIPATASQLKVWRRHLLAKRLLRTLWAHLNRGRRHLAHQLLLVTTRGTLKIVDRHLLTQPEGQLAGKISPSANYTLIRVTNHQKHRDVFELKRL